MNKITSAILAFIPLSLMSAVASAESTKGLDQALQQMSVKQAAPQCEMQGELCNNSVISGEALPNVYYLLLRGASASEISSMDESLDRRSQLKAISAEQKSLIDALKALQPNIVIVSQSKLLSNAITVQMSDDVAKTVKNWPSVLDVVKTNLPATFTSDKQSQDLPQLKVNSDDGNITVALIGNGVDYTHKSLGGLGTRAAYERAWKNRSNAFDGFPTSTVIGGLDFSADSEGYHSLDYNPIEDENNINVINKLLPSGTAQASIILKEAKNAKLYAYKTYDWDWVYFTNALDFVIDPNQDGDLSDRPDIVLINSYGNGAFYQSSGTDGSAATLIIDHIRRISALGSLVVVPAGSIPSDTFFNLAWAGAAPDALTVGSVAVKADGQRVISSFSPAGPVRGSHLLKPEVLGQAEDWTAAAVGQATENSVQFASSAYAASQIAGIAADTWAKNPKLSAQEIKVLIANSASTENLVGQTIEMDFNGKSHTIMTAPEVPFSGSGYASALSANTTKAIVWDSQNWQPNLAFGFAKVSGKQAFTKNVTLRNLDNKTQRFQVTSSLQGQKADYAALKVSAPETVQVAANSTVTFPVTIEVDGNLLSGNSVMHREDYTIPKWLESSFSGALTLTSAQSKLSLPWSMLPIAAVPMPRTNEAYSSNLPFQDPEWENASNLAYNYSESVYIDVANTSNAPQHMLAMPLMLKRADKGEGKSEAQGHFIKDAGAIVTSNNQCISGHALSVGINFFDPIDLPIAEHFDKIGSVLTTINIYSQAIADQYKDDPLSLEMNAWEQDRLAYFEVGVSETGQLVAEYIDWNMEYDRLAPRSRFKQSKLPVTAAAGGRSLVVNACIDELAHGVTQDITAWNQNLGWQFATDRDAQAPAKGEVIRFNPVIQGQFTQTVIDHTGEDGYPYWWDFNCQPMEWDPNYCIENKVTFAAARVVGALLPNENTSNEALQWQNRITIPAGGKARFLSNVTMQCDPNQLSVGPVKLAEECPAGVMVVNLTTGDARYGDGNTAADNTVLPDQAFVVAENSENGTVVGRLALDVPKFFYPTDYQPGEVFLLTAIPGTPFMVTKDGWLKVNNREALDFEGVRHFEFEVQADFSNRVTQNVKVKIDLSDVNDIAPSQLIELPAQTIEEGKTVSVSIADAFTDVEGQGLTFVATGLPSGLTLSIDGELEGAPAQAGTFNVALQVSDGLNIKQSTMVLNVTAKPKVTTPKESGGSFGGGASLWMLLVLLFLTSTRRRSL